ncbi:MAG: membrane-associated protein [Gemmatimonadaceae bacterium]
MIPLWLKVAYTLFLCVLVPAYWRKADAGPLNFLWFSDIALLATCLALWLENRLLASTMAVGVLLPEIFWNVSFLVQLVTGKRLTNLTDYMFDSKRSRFMRGLSLFHVILPPLLLWLVARLGYDVRAFPAMTLLSTIVLPLTYATTDPEHNINWVHGWGSAHSTGLPPLVHLALLMIAFPVLIFLPTHLILDAGF